MNNILPQHTSDSRDVENFLYLNKYIKHPNVEIGDYTYGNLLIRYASEGNRLKIGKYCSLAPGVNIFLGGEHNVKSVSNYPFPYLVSDYPKARKNQGGKTKGDVTIGNDVWIGENVLILSGVTIGDGAVIGARAVIAKDVPPYGVAVGSPARIARKRFDEENIRKLLAIKWWDWELDKIKEYADLISGEDVAEFTGRFYKG